MEVWKEIKYFDFVSSAGPKFCAKEKGDAIKHTKVKEKKRKPIFFIIRYNPPYEMFKPSYLEGKANSYKLQPAFLVLS